MINLAIILFASLFACAPGESEKEKAVKAYYAGFETHNWNIVEAQLTPEFTFTTPAGDDHISLTVFKQRCWDTNAFFKKVKTMKMTPSGDDILLLVEIATTDGKVVRNIDLVTFAGGKIKSIEVFFGAGPGYPGSSK